MRTATSCLVPCGMLLLLLFLPAPHSEAAVIFDFSGICVSGDCAAGSAVLGELVFSDDAELRHRTRTVTAEDFVSLVLEVTPVGKAEASAQWSPASENGIIQPLEVVIDAADELVALWLRDDLVNAFQVDEGGAWQYRQIQISPEGQLVTDLTFTGSDGSLKRRSVAVSEPTAIALLSFGFGVVVSRRRP